MKHPLFGKNNRALKIVRPPAVEYDTDRLKTSFKLIAGPQNQRMNGFRSIEDFVVYGPN